MRISYRGMAIILAGLSVAAWTLPAPVETVLYRFQGTSDGLFPAFGVIADEQGALYGITEAFGSNNGLVFKLAPPAKGQTTWTETVLYSFCSLSNCSDGANPQAGLIADKQGALYGTTFNGGNSNNGLVFKLTPPDRGQTTWTETVLYRFQGGSDGAAPAAALIADEQGTLYGTTFGGGISNNGTVFKLTPPAKGQTTWTETVLYRFQGGSDGLNPQKAAMIADKQGALYSTTVVGGSGGNRGTVFKLTPPAKGRTAWTETVLYSFKGGSDGLNPGAGLIAEKHGALYSTTIFGGGTGNLGNGNGTVFKLALCPERERGWREKDDDHDREKDHDHDGCPDFQSME